MSMEESKIEPIPAIILSGGRSRRVGRDKATLPLGSQTVLRRIENCFRQFASPLIVVGNRQKKLDVHGDSVLVHDEIADLGPLEGIRVGLKYCFEHSSLAYVGTCDAPLVVPALYQLMRHRIGSHNAIAPRIEGQLYPLTAVYRTSILNDIESLVDARHLKVRAMFEELGGITLGEADVRAVDPDLATIQNINTMADYERVRRTCDQDQD